MQISHTYFSLYPVKFKVHFFSNESDSPAKQCHLLTKYSPLFILLLLPLQLQLSTQMHLKTILLWRSSSSSFSSIASSFPDDSWPTATYCNRSCSAGIRVHVKRRRKRGRNKKNNVHSPDIQGGRGGVGWSCATEQNGNQPPIIISPPTPPPLTHRLPLFHANNQRLKPGHLK